MANFKVLSGPLATARRRADAHSVEKNARPAHSRILSENLHCFHVQKTLENCHPLLIFLVPVDQFFFGAHPRYVFFD